MKCNIVSGLNPFPARPFENQIRCMFVGALYGVRRKQDGKQVSCARQQESNQDCGVEEGAGRLLVDGTQQLYLTLILLTWRIGRVPNNASKW
jgi:hypothetical protein